MLNGAEEVVAYSRIRGETTHTKSAIKTAGPECGFVAHTHHTQNNSVMGPTGCVPETLSGHVRSANPTIVMCRTRHSSYTPRANSCGYGRLSAIGEARNVMTFHIVANTGGA